MSHRRFMMSSLFGARLASVVVALAGASTAAIATTPTFQPLGNLGGFPAESIAWAVSGNGLVVVGESPSLLAGDNPQAWRQPLGGSLVGLGSLSVVFDLSFAYGVSSDGRYTVGASFAEPDFLLQGFRHDAQTNALLPLGGLPGGPLNSIANAVNANGSVVVGQAKSLGTNAAQRDEAFRWRAGVGMQGLGFLPGDSGSVANGVSADGTTVVGWSSNLLNRTEAFIWRSPGPMQGLGDLAGGGTSSIAVAVSADGQTVVGQASTAQGLVAFRHNAAYGMQVVGDLPGGAVNAQARAVSGSGNVVVGYATTDTSGNDGEAFIWDYRGMRSLRQTLVDAGVNMTGWRLLWANGLSLDGTVIVGYGLNPLGQLQAFRAVLPFCGPDFNVDSTLNQEDLSGFITCFIGSVEGFEPCAAADYNADTFVDQEDLSAYLTEYFSDAPACI